MAASSRVPIINALSDLEHPCQAIADFFTIEERFGSAEGVRFAYVGDGNNVCHSLMLTAAQLGAHCTVAAPKGFSPKLEIIHKAIEIAESTGGSIHPHHRSHQGRHRRRRRLHRRLHLHGLRARGHQARPHLQALLQVNEELMAHAQPHAIFMHCLPAHRNAEVTDAVLDGPQSVVFDQAENRMHAQKAIILMLLGGAKRISNSRSRGLQAPRKR